MSTAAKALAIGLVAGALYFPGLAHSPPYLAHDEAYFGIQAQSVANTGRDINGRFLPLYFSEPGFEIGRDPLHVYLTALVLKVRPLSESSVRLAAAIVGVASIMLMFVCARLIFGREWLAWAAAGIMLLTPVHFIHSRLGLSVIYPVPFVIGWLLCLAIYWQRARLLWLFAATMTLGVGIYSYLAAVVLMPLYCVATLGVLLNRRAARPLLVAAAGFLIPLSLLVWWQMSHPDRYRDIVNSYSVYDATRLGPLQGLRDLTSYFSLGERTSVYWQAFNPGRFFFTGDSGIAKSTRLVGLFLLPVAVFLPVGVVALVQSRRSALGLLLLVGLLTAPLPEVLVGHGEIGRWLIIVPFVALISTFGLEALWSSARRELRVLAALLLLAMPVQFWMFYTDYTNDYRVRAAIWMGGNMRGAVEQAIRQDPETAYLSEAIPNINAYWDFYALAHGDNAPKIPVIYVGAGQVPVIDPSRRAIFITPVVDGSAAGVLREAGWGLAAEITNLDEALSYLVWARPPAAR